MTYDLRWYQQESCDAAWLHLCSRAGNPVIVLPTGGGKSIVIAEIVRRAVQEFKGRVMILAHRAELLQQNAEKVRAMLPFGVTTGIYSAGLRKFSTDADVVLAGIQSVHRKPELFGPRQLVLIDEVHLVPHDGEGMYRNFLGKLREYNPKLRMIGLTATAYRTGEGSICRPDGLFQKVCYEASIPRLIEDGFLSRLTNQPAVAHVDTSGLHVRGGEFIPSEMELLFDDSAKVKAACAEVAAKTSDRKSVLVFCAGVGHAQHVKETLEQHVGQVGIVTGNTLPMERSATLQRFRAGHLRYLVNVDVLTTGFDAPGIDAIAILRATQSPGLFAQICGRGFRVAPLKQDCLILDFGENIQRHGPLDAIDFGKAKKREFGGGDAPSKQCPNCEAECPASCLACEECGFKFPPRQLNHDEIADANSDLFVTPKTFTVEECRMARHVKRKKTDEAAPDTLRVDYLCKGDGNIEETISEWVCLEHSGFAFKKAMLWWLLRSKADPFAGGSNANPIDSAIDLWKRGAVALSSRLTAVKDGHFWRITEHDLDPVPESWSDEVAEDVFENMDSEEIPF